MYVDFAATSCPLHGIRQPARAHHGRDFLLATPPLEKRLLRSLTPAARESTVFDDAAIRILLPRMPLSLRKQFVIDRVSKHSSR